jgi:hypothetical protein
MSEKSCFVLSRVTAFQENDLIVVDRQDVNEFGDDEVPAAFDTFTLAEFAAEYAKRLRGDERLVAVSKVLSLREPDGSSIDIAREDFRLPNDAPALLS